MIGLQLEIQLVAVLTAVACALSGTFLVLRRVALLSDAISHVVLLGIVVMFLLTRDLHSPLLIVGAALTGLLTVGLVSLLLRTGLVREDAAIGLVFPLLFSLGVILVSRYAEYVHLDVDAVLLGELAFVPFDRLTMGDLDLGPRRAWLMGGLLLLNLVFVLGLYKELKLTAFDPALAAALGFSPALVHTLHLGVVSLTAVGAFDAVGAVLVVALFIVPPATALLLSERLAVVLVLAVLLGGAAAVGGYWLAHTFDTSIAGSMVSLSGLLFALAFLGAPQRGLLVRLWRHRRQRWEFALRLLVMHLLTHEGTVAERDEAALAALPQHLRWEPAFAREVARRAEQAGLVERRNGLLRLTARGRALAQQALLDGQD